MRKIQSKASSCHPRARSTVAFLRWFVSLLILTITLAACSAATVPSTGSTFTMAPKETLSAWGGTSPIVVAGGPGETPKALNILRSGGLAAYSESISFLTNASSLVVLGDAILSKPQIDAILTWTRRGGYLVSFNRVLNSALGVKLLPANLYPKALVPFVGTPVTIKNPIKITPISLTKGFDPLVFGGSTANPSNAFVASEGFGIGKALISTFDPFGGAFLGYEVIPSLARMIGGFTNAPHGAQSLMTTVFVDPGVLGPNLEYNYAQIANDLYGVRAVELAAWDFGFSVPSANYPYQKLISALHARGILVYAWLEPPFVNDALWQKYPQCREKTQSGSQAIGGWRELIALEDPTCYALAWSQFSNVLTSYNWDGVNFAELYFETLATPALSTPYSSAALSQFGKDPLTNPAAWIQFRYSLVDRLYSELLKSANGLAKAKSLAFQITVIDDSIDPVEAQDIGMNVHQLAKVASNAGASMIIEDPYTVWKQGPNRYVGVNKYISSMVTTPNYSIDINDVQRGASAAPTPKPTMGEFNLASMFAGANSSRVDFYALGTIASYDMANLSYGVAGSTVYFPNGLSSKFPVVLSVKSSYGRLKVDGVQWPVSGGVGVIPAGQHNLVWEKGSPLSPGLMRIDAAISTAKVISSKSISFDYYSRSATYALLSSPPRSITAKGGAAITFQPDQDPLGGYWVRLPSGTQSITIDF